MTTASSWNRARGFTLVELMVVLAVISLLVAMLLPMLDAAKDTARITQCASNLNQLGIAYQTRGAEIANTSRPLSTPIVGDPYAWPALLGAYTGGEGGVLECPSDESLNELWDGMDPSGGDFDKFVSAPGYEWLAYTHFEGQRLGVHIPCSNSHPVMATVSWSGAGYGAESNRWKAAYSPKPDQALIFTCARVKFWLKHGLDVGASYDGGSSGWGHEHQFSFVPVEEDDEGVTIEAMGWKIQHGEEFRYNGVDGEHGRFYHKGHEVRHQNEWHPASYGMNNRAAHLRRGERRVLLVDYEKVVADVVTGSDNAPADSWSYEMERVMGRHRGQINVLWSDGSVDTTWPSAIDPRGSEIHDDLWLPRREPKLAG